MRKILSVLFLFSLLSTGVNGQFKIGLSVQPGFISNRIASDIDSLDYSAGDSKIKPWLGLFIDVELKENYYFTSGIYWAPKSLNLRMEGAGSASDLQMNVQYLQIPFLLKLLTDEIALDKKIYFNIGPAFDIRIEESIGNNKEELYIDKINLFDLNLNIGAGMEFKIGQNTVLVAGLSYYRGMINAAKPVTGLKDKLRVKNDFYAINLGIKF